MWCRETLQKNFLSRNVYETDLKFFDRFYLFILFIYLLTRIYVLYFTIFHLCSYLCTCFIDNLFFRILRVFYIFILFSNNVYAENEYFIAAEKIETGNFIVPIMCYFN